MKQFIFRLCLLAFFIHANFSIAFLYADDKVVAKKKPLNVLFIIADDLNNVLGCYGDKQIKTPHIDKLAARGVLFNKAYCTYPLCGPSRNSMLTGLYPNSTGILTNGQIFRQTIPNQISMPQAFRHKGFLATRIGKMYHYNVPNSVGTNGHDDPASWEIEINPAGVERTEELPITKTLQPNQFGGTLSWLASEKSDEFHTDAMQAADAEWVLERCAKQKDRPFFLSVGFFRPHTPYTSPKKYFDQYNRAEMEVVKGVEEDQKNRPASSLMSAKKEQDKLTDEVKQEIRQAYYASISFMDAQVGKVVDTLDRLKLSDSTIIVFTSDHGYHLGEHGLWQKQSLFEESSRVPLIIVAPSSTGCKPGIVQAPVSHVDLYPTLLNLSGISTKTKLQGQDLSELMADHQKTGRNWALTQVVRNTPANQNQKLTPYSGYSLRTARYRYTEWDDGKKGVELYDHEVDPKEMKNLATTPESADMVKQLSAELIKAVKSTFPENGKVPEIKPGLWAPILSPVP